MAFKIYKKNNYIIIEDTVENKQYQGHLKNVFIYKNEKFENVYEFEGLDDDGLKGVSVLDMIDGSNIPFTVNTFETFYTTETGSAGASVGGGSGDASAANQVLEIAKLTSIDNKAPSLVSGKIPVDGSGVTQPISAVALPLPNGASTEATLIQVRDYLDTVETKLASLITNTTGLTLEATQIQVRDYLDTVETKLASIITNTSGINLEATQLLIKSALDNMSNKLSFSSISSLNSSTTILGSGASFTGTNEDVTAYSSITVNVDSDLVGTLSAQFSQNGVNYTSIPRTFFNVSNGQTYTFTRGTRYFRIVYTNTSGTQSFFRLQTIFNSDPIGSILAPANTPLTPNSLAQAVISLPNDGVKTTYTASVSNSVPAAVTPTDVFVITGSATKTIRISKVLVSGTRTTPTQTDIVLIKRSSVNTGGTFTAVTPASNDSVNPASTASVKAYTANPTTGTSVGLIYSVSLFMPGVATAAAGGIFQYEFGRLGQTVVLRGVNESLAINLIGVATLSGGSFNYTIEWTEE